MAAVTQIRRPAVTVKEKRGAILKIAPQTLRKVTNKDCGIIAAQKVCGANSEKAPAERQEIVATETIRGAKCKIAPDIH